MPLLDLPHVVCNCRCMMGNTRVLLSCRALIQPVLMRVMHRQLSMSFKAWRGAVAALISLKQLGAAVCCRLMQWRTALVFHRWKVQQRICHLMLALRGLWRTLKHAVAFWPDLCKESEGSKGL